MKNIILSGVGVAAALLTGAGFASAADLAVKAPVYKAPPPVESDWSGFYIGVNGGYGWGSTTFDDPFSIANAKPEGGLVGGHAGYNWQYGSVVTGLEVDYDWADITASDTLLSGVRRDKRFSLDRDLKFDALATARARLGYLVLPNLLAYGTGGIAWGHSTLSFSSPFGSVDADASSFGWTAGAGLEYKLWEHVLVRGEYLHYDFATTTYSFPLFSANAGTTIDTVRAGLTYKF